MHYANGRAAKAGDVVRGKGYNIKHEITGLLVFANPTATVCNCQVVTVTANVNVEAAKTSEGAIFLQPKYPGSLSSLVQYGWATLEYGQLDAFVALDSVTGQVLPPEDAAQPGA